MTGSPRICGEFLLFGLSMRSTLGFVPRRTTSFTGATLLTASERVTVFVVLLNVYVTTVSIYPFTPGVFTRCSPRGNVGSSSYDTEKSFSTRVVKPLVPFLITFGCPGVTTLPVASTTSATPWLATRSLPPSNSGSSS